MYLAASARTVQASWDKFRTCSVVLDEARFSNAEILQVFLACPMDAGSSAGTVLPPQVLPQLHLDLQAVDAELRITEANRRGASARVPKGDPLVATWETCVGLHRALCSVLPHGFIEFLPQKAPERICALRLGTYALERGGVEVALPATPAKLDHFGCGGRLGVWPAEEAGDFAPLIEPGHSVSKVPNALRWGGHTQNQHCWTCWARPSKTSRSSHATQQSFDGSCSHHPRCLHLRSLHGVGSGKQSFKGWFPTFGSGAQVVFQEWLPPSNCSAVKFQEWPPIVPFEWACFCHATQDRQQYVNHFKPSLVRAPASQTLSKFMPCRVPDCMAQFPLPQVMA
jgi:hypothetical protein